MTDALTHGEPDYVSDPSIARAIVERLMSSGAAISHPTFKHISKVLSPFDASLRASARVQSQPSSSSASSHHHTTANRRQRTGGHSDAPPSACTATCTSTSKTPRSQHSASGRGKPGRHGHHHRGRRETRDWRGNGGIETTTVADKGNRRSGLTHHKNDDSLFVGALNRLNRSNYSRIYAEVVEALREQATEERVLRVLDLLLLQCCAQAFFVDLYVRLAKDLISERDRADPALAGLMRERVTRFVDTFMLHTLPTVVTDITVDTERGDADSAALSDEDEYCRFVKRRALISGANKAVLRLGGDQRQRAEYGDRVRECVGRATDHASLLLLLDFVIEYASVVRDPGARNAARACCMRAEQRYAELGVDHPQSRFRLLDLRRALSV